MGRCIGLLGPSHTASDASERSCFPSTHQELKTAHHHFLPGGLRSIWNSVRELPPTSIWVMASMIPTDTPKLLKVWGQGSRFLEQKCATVPQQQAVRKHQFIRCWTQPFTGCLRCPDPPARHCNSPKRLLVAEAPLRLPSARSGGLGPTFWFQVFKSWNQKVGLAVSKSRIPHGPGRGASEIPDLA